MNKEDRRREQEFQERLMDELLKNAAMELVKREIKRFPREEECEYEPSQTFKDTMEKLLKQAEKRAWWQEYSKDITKMVASIVIVGLVASTTVMSVEAFRVPIFNFLMEQQEKYSKLEIKEKSEQEKTEYDYDVLLKQYPGLALPMDVPEGYEYGGTIGSEGKYVTEYRNMEQHKIILVQSSDISTHGIDTEKTYKDSQKIGDIECKIFYSNDITTLVWERNEVTYNLSAGMEEKELKKMMKNMHYSN